MLPTALMTTVAVPLLAEAVCTPHAFCSYEKVKAQHLPAETNACKNVSHEQPEHSETKASCCCSLSMFDYVHDSFLWPVSLHFKCHSIVQ